MVGAKKNIESIQDPLEGGEEESSSDSSSDEEDSSSESSSRSSDSDDSSSASIEDEAYLHDGYLLGKMLAENRMGCVSGAGKTGARIAERGSQL